METGSAQPLTCSLGAIITDADVLSGRAPAPEYVLGSPHQVKRGTEGVEQSMESAQGSDDSKRFACNV